ncbi:hypothetical protein [Microbacterium sp. TPU 3598]|uniref:hypothetical protein n=1 Tax=Microbacterium sp. TPU 3598 TaxID=1938334 RepID=UPI000BBADC9E|nr:hypothetical protein [Microbacterium sp. TPU 3598]
MSTAPSPNPWADIIGPCYTTASLARTLGWTEAKVAAAAACLDVLELTSTDGVTLYPAFQVRQGLPVQGLGEVLRVLSTGTAGRWTWAQWLNTRLPDGEGEGQPSAVDKLRAGHLDDVLRDARHDAWAWSS